MAEFLVDLIGEIISAVLEAVFLGGGDNERREKDGR